MGGGGSARRVFFRYTVPPSTQQRRWVTMGVVQLTHSLGRSQWMKCLKQTQNCQAATADNLHTGFISSRSVALLIWPERVFVFLCFFCVFSVIRTTEFQVSSGDSCLKYMWWLVADRPDMLEFPHEPTSLNEDPVASTRKEFQSRGGVNLVKLKIHLTHYNQLKYTVI